jgi:very-short-patch-repair endonuclease
MADMGMTLNKKKAFIHKAFRKANEEPDVQVKREIKNALVKYKILLLENETVKTDNGYRRPDLLDKTNKLVIEIDGTWHGTQKGQKHDDKRNADYKKLGFKVIIVETELLNFLEISPEQYIVPCLYQMKIFNNLKVDF